MSDWKGTERPGKFNADFLARFQSPSPDPNPVVRNTPPKRKKFGADRFAMFDSSSQPSSGDDNPPPVPPVPGAAASQPPPIKKKAHRLSRNMAINLDAFRPGAKFKKKPSPSPPPPPGIDPALLVSSKQGDDALMDRPTNNRRKSRRSKRHTFDVSSPRTVAAPQKRWSVITEDVPQDLDEIRQALGKPPGAFPELSPKSARILNGEEKGPHDIRLVSPAADPNENDLSISDPASQEEDIEFEIPPADLHESENLSPQQLQAIKEESASPAQSPIRTPPPRTTPPPSASQPNHHPSLIEGPAGRLDESGLPNDNFAPAMVSPSPQPVFEESAPPAAFSPPTEEHPPEKPFKPAAVYIPPHSEVTSPQRRPPPRKTTSRSPKPPPRKMNDPPVLTSLADSSAQAQENETSNITPPHETPFQRAKRMAQQAANNKSQKRNSIVTRKNDNRIGSSRGDAHVLSPQKEERKPRANTEPASSFEDYTAPETRSPQKRAVSASPRFFVDESVLLEKKERLEREIADMERQLAGQKAEWLELERTSIQGMVDNMRPIELLRKMADFCANANEDELRVIRRILETELR